MSYSYLPDIVTSDVAFSAKGDTLNELFTAAGDALMNVMVDDLSSIEDIERRNIAISAGTPDLLLFDYLNEFIFYKDSQLLLLRPASISVSCDHELCHLEAVLYGDTLQPEKHHPGVDVKAVTLHKLKVENTGEEWEATVVLDI